MKENKEPKQISAKIILGRVGRTKNLGNLGECEKREIKRSMRNSLSLLETLICERLTEIKVYRCCE